MKLSDLALKVSNACYLSPLDRASLVHSIETGDIAELKAARAERAELVSLNASLRLALTFRDQLARDLAEAKAERVELVSDLSAATTAYREALVELADVKDQLAGSTAATGALLDSLADSEDSRHSLANQLSAIKDQLAAVRIDRVGPVEIPVTLSVSMRFDPRGKFG